MRGAFWWVVFGVGCGTEPQQTPADDAPADSEVTEPTDDPSDDPVGDSDVAGDPEDDASEGPCPGVPISLTYGTATTNFDFVPALPGTRSRIVIGDQGGAHIWGSAMIDGTQQQVRIDTRAVDVGTGAVISEARFFRGLESVSGTEWACHGRAAGIVHQIDFSQVDPRADPLVGWWALCGREVDLEATFVDPFTETVLISDTCRVIADAPAGFDACPGPPAP